MALLWDDRLIGWLVFLRLQADHGAERVWCPDVVRVSLSSKGWIKTSDNPLEDVDYELTDEGKKVSDLYAAEWAVDAIPEVGA